MAEENLEQTVYYVSHHVQEIFSKIYITKHYKVDKTS